MNIRGVRSRGSRVPELVSPEAGARHSSGTRMISQPGSLRTPYSRHRYGGSVTFARPVTTRPQPCSPPQRMGGRAESCKLQIIAWSFCSSTLTQEPSWSHLFRTKDTPVAEEIWMGLGAPCQKPGVETKTPVLTVHLVTCSANTGQGRPRRSPEPWPSSAHPCQLGCPAVLLLKGLCQRCSMTQDTPQGGLRTSLWQTPTRSDESFRPN